ncbi:hypothetical protein QFC21_001823 [Naganishia friedmannii]|uniref:Uncharacterized protein n=1 Tax=Naganishia friedmannii TaxID=89922 RepID=A0ACC2W4A1_9TREE|nr:hypothetical protein QFC21_001823 [Naganishia friedmannii]
MPDALQQLLQWSTSNSGNSSATAAAPKEDAAPALSTSGSTAAAPVQPKKFDTAILDHIMGKSEAVIMREKLAIAVDEDQDLSERIMAMDDFEMATGELVESIDNATDMQNMGLWPKVLDLLNDKQDPIIKLACWICGTAIQNNPKAQEAFHSHKPMSKLYSIISSIHPTDSNIQISNSTRAKAVYSLSAALKHWPAAVADLSSDADRGWATLRDGLSDPDVTVRRKIAFLLSTLLLQSDDYTDAGVIIENPVTSTSPNKTVQKMAETKVLDALIRSLVKPLPMGPDGDISEPDWDLQEKCTRALVSALERGGLDAEQRKVLQDLWKGWKMDKEWDEVGYTEAEAQEALKLL